MSNDSNFDSLFTPFSIGKMEIKNRLVMSPMGTYAALMDGSVSDTLATYFKSVQRAVSARLSPLPSISRRSWPRASTAPILTASASSPI